LFRHLSLIAVSFTQAKIRGVFKNYYYYYYYYYFTFWRLQSEIS